VGDTDVHRGQFPSCRRSGDRTGLPAQATEPRRSGPAISSEGGQVSAEQVPDTASAELEVVVDDRRLVLSPVRPFVIGRGMGVDLELTHPNVSRQHLVLEPGAAGWTLTDRSRNGTFLGEERITRLTIGAPTTVRLGGAADGVQIELVPRRPGERAGLETRLAGQGRLSGVHQVRGQRITVGRLPDNDVVLDDLLVSRRHAQLDLTPSGYRITDLGTGNGTFVNGQRVTEAILQPGDVIGIGHALLQLDGDRLIGFVDTGGNTFEADGLTVTTSKGKTLLQSVSFALPGRSLLAVIGPSGAGKSTLLNALIGARPADVGHVRYAERDLYDDYDELRHRIALVPQDDVLHTQLSVRQALSYAARLRFPADTTEADRRLRVDEVLAELGLSAQADQRITSLSGGQRKRTSVALELLVKPSLLFLDEPTSGLDPGMDRSVMRTLRSIADDGRTVVVVTHNVANLEVCDQLLILAPGGWVAYFGPPDGALRYFDQPDFADIFIQLTTAPGEHWARRFRESADHERSVGAPHAPHEGRPSPRALPGGSPRQQGPFSQLAVLFRRYVAVIASDRQYAISLAVLPLVLSLLARAVPGSSGLSVTAAQQAGDPPPTQLLIVLIIGAALMGAAASVRELVKERPVYQRERAIGLSIGAYLVSKVLVLGIITGLQATFFTLISLLGRDGPDNPVVLPWGRAEILLAVLGVTWTSMLIGLAISAAIDNADRGMPLLVLVIMVQLVFCGGLFPVHDRLVIEQLAWLVPSRWGFAMTAATTDLSRLDRGPSDPLWEPTASGWFSNATLLIAIMIALTAVIVVLVARLDPHRRTAKA
jgi:ABC-type multidrug transport system ATPase subunit/pSer/pThr/pTyr-binding forkhead associated (FHA) protein